MCRDIGLFQMVAMTIILATESEPQVQILVSSLEAKIPLYRFSGFTENSDCTYFMPVAMTILMSNQNFFMSTLTGGCIPSCSFNSSVAYQSGHWS